MSEIILSDSMDRIDWSEARRYAHSYGVKGATSLAIPRAWTLPFALLPTNLTVAVKAGASIASLIGEPMLAHFAEMGGDAERLIVRSSVIGETIWDRGTYHSSIIDISGDTKAIAEQIEAAARDVISSTQGLPTGLMVQNYFDPKSQGEFGNLQRVSKTRDHWEISTREPGDIILRQRLNSPRDQAADPDEPLVARAGLSRERLFGTIGAWLNNELLLGHAERLNCEWLTDNRRFYLVQIDEEHEDLSGVNPFQVRIPASVQPAASSGFYLKSADGIARKSWDKLEVLNELWEEDAKHKPMLFFAPVARLLEEPPQAALLNLEADFRNLIGETGIVVRTSVRSGKEKLLNLPRTECLGPDAAARWCFDAARQLSRDYEAEMAFIAHRFVAARASAWARAEPGNPMVEINALWGLPDALQYCPYDIWEVHVPTGVATDYPDYKSDMLISTPDGGWEYVRVKNELARSNSISSTEAKEIAARSSSIADRLRKPCHIMWFVGCLERDGKKFNLPWYWTPAHDADRNIDRSSYRVITICDRSSLANFIDLPGSRNRQAVSLKPNELTLMRDNSFIKSVGIAAKAAQVPVILAGSTLAHAYFQLRKLGCTIVTPSEKEHGRVRRATTFGKLVRDKIPDKINRRQEASVTRQISGNLLKGFLISKLLEEALEVREAVEASQKIEELADLFEVFRALAAAEEVSLEIIAGTADQKKKKAGGFEKGLVLMQTSINAPDRNALADLDRGFSEALSQQVLGDTAEIPFSFFGFMEIDQPRSINFERLGMRVDVVLRPDRLEIKLFRRAEQLSLPLKG